MFRSPHIFRALCRLLPAAILLFCMDGKAPAEEPAFRAPYDGLQAGYEAWRRGESRRRDDIARQWWLNDYQRWEAYTYPYGESAIFADPYYAGYGYAPGSVYASPWGATGTGGLFGGWRVDNVPQPIGQWNGQTGPTTWESHPIYPEPPPEAAPPVRPLPPPRQQPAPNDLIPPPAPRGGPRQF